MGGVREMSADRYDVFLSYSHVDAALAERISRRVRNYRPPRAAGLSRRKLEVFRDRERLTANPNLGDFWPMPSASRSTSCCWRHPLPHSLNTSTRKWRRSSVARVVLEFRSSPATVSCRTISLRGCARRAANRSISICAMPDAGRSDSKTLRLIAALYGVDYSELRREDDLRRLRNRALAVTATVALALGLGSAYLVNTTPAEAWEQVLQPATTAGPDPLMPIEARRGPHQRSVYDRLAGRQRPLQA